ncbi:hypothetical protein GCM10023201_52490 [Actinomycetospora corticicola]|uniref:Uncharacterized protein n=1 Tax=Actinomycetospora corticicola TaxID=663602 RepID=A0A7Y9DXR5_9PSEU|nr:hypothetical protein [Actinomycetospora corticicola]NYD37489.1 hypothetical protein [Actinomycetospora corticicola]
MTPTPRRVALAVSGAALVLALAGCGGGDSETSASSSAPAAPAATSATSASAAPAGGQKISANNASEDELAQRFEQAGIPNAEKWADEVVEYRPYPADDPNFNALREELAKYNPGPGVVDQIVAVLQP